MTTLKSFEMIDDYDLKPTMYDDIDIDDDMDDDDNETYGIEAGDEVIDEWGCVQIVTWIGYGTAHTIDSKGYTSFLTDASRLTKTGKSYDSIPIKKTKKHHVA